jgi:hypothetical protein
MAELQLPKLIARVRFPSSALELKKASGHISVRELAFERARQGSVAQREARQLS